MSVEEHGGDIDKQSKLLFDAWEAMGETFLEQSRHISTIKIARRMVDIITSSGAPAAPMVVLALALKEGHEKLMAKVRELDPELADKVDQSENK